MNEYVHLALINDMLYLIIQLGKLSIVDPTIRVYSNSFTQNEVEASIPMYDNYNQKD